MSILEIAMCVWTVCEYLYDNGIDVCCVWMHINNLCDRSSIQKSFRLTAWPDASMHINAEINHNVDDMSPIIHY